MGARVKVMGAEPVPIRGRWMSARATEQPPQIVIDIPRDNRGELFEIRTAPGSRQEIDVLNAQPREKHLVLLSRQFDVQGGLLAKQKFLCGWDEKHWFVAVIPESEPVSTVASAKIALKPEEVRTREQALGISRTSSFQRRNAAYVRQGKGLDRLIVVTDEQSHDGILPAWTRKACVANVAPYKNGLSYGNGWTHIDGWSERVVDYITAVEKESTE